MKEKIGKCHDCTAPQTEVNMLSRHILELQADKGRLTDSVRELEEKLANADYQLEGRDLEISELKERLEQAKEIIKELLDTQSRLDPYRSIFRDRILKAEQFLNSEV